MFEALFFLTFAALLAPLGRWGRRHVPDLVPGHYADEDREHRTKVLRRGALAAEVVAVMFFISGVLLLFG